MKKIDEQSRKIIKELILQPRSSDNLVSRKTGIPLKTVNRKRKLMESEGLLKFYANIDLSHQGAGIFKGRDLYLVKFKEGITKDMFMSGFMKIQLRYAHFKHVLESFVAERDGRVMLIFILESIRQEDLIEIFNAEIVPEIHNILGKDCIHSIETIRLSHQLNLLHNYLLDDNLRNRFPDDESRRGMTFVDD